MTIWGSTVPNLVKKRGRRSTRNTKTITWPDGTMSARFVTRNNKRNIESIFYSRSKRGYYYHRPDDKPAHITFHSLTGEPAFVQWCVEGNYSGIRLNAELPTLWESDVFYWEQNHGQCNTNGPSWINANGEQGFCIDDIALTADEFKERYLITHLEEYVEVDVKALYSKLYVEMMECVQQELLNT